MQQACGSLFLDGLLKYAGDNPEKVRLLAAGFVTGQAEKVYLGACMAAMFRPSEAYRDMVWHLVVDIARRYELCFDAIGDETWIWHPKAHGLISAMVHACELSEEWHSIRGLLCGVPAREIDPTFHLRKGYGESCDRKEA